MNRRSKIIQPAYTQRFYILWTPSLFGEKNFYRTISVIFLTYMKNDFNSIAFHDYGFIWQRYISTDVNSEKKNSASLHAKVLYHLIFLLLMEKESSMKQFLFSSEIARRMIFGLPPIFFPNGKFYKTIPLLFGTVMKSDFTL